MKWKCVYVDQVRRFSLEIEVGTGQTAVACPVDNGLVEYPEWYAVDGETFARYCQDPTLAHEFVARCKRRELDHLLVIPPGSKRGVAE